MSEITHTKLEEIKEKTDKYLVGNYKRQDIAFKYGVGEMLFDMDNKPYIDFLCGISVTNLGHSDADIIDALRSQADMLFHTSNLFYSEEAANLAEALVENSFPAKVFFCNSGTEANELAFKIARLHGIAQKMEKPVVLSLAKSFHGRTVSAMTITGQEKVRQGFGELLPDIDYITENDIDSLQAAFDRYQGRVAAFIMEPIIGEGGIIPISDEFAILARKLTQDENALLIFDEIQTGIGRTGKLFGYEHFNFQPDVMTLAKALGSGFPIGAVMVGEKYESLLTPGTHGSTFGGNHLAMRVAYETLKIIVGREILQHVNALSDFFFTKLNIMKTKYDILKEVRGKGLHIGLDFTIQAPQIAEECLRNGLVVNATAGSVIRIMPPLNISIEKVNEGLSILENVIAKFAKDSKTESYSVS